MDPDQFGPLMEKAYKDALNAADAIKAVAQADREAASQELDAAKAARQAVEAETEKTELYRGICDKNGKELFEQRAVVARPHW